MEIEEIVKKLTREELETKFINLFNKIKQYEKKEKEVKIEIPESFKAENYVNFTKYKMKRRQQYLHKTYTKNAKALNTLLNILIETRDANLQSYFNNLHNELEKIATENQDLPIK